MQTLFGRKIHTPEINAKGPARRLRLARRDQRADPGHRGRRDPPRDDPDAGRDRRACPREMLLQVHDELLFEVEDGAVDETIARAREVMEGAADPAVHLDVPLIVDAGQGANWAEAH